MLGCARSARSGAGTAQPCAPAQTAAGTPRSLCQQQPEDRNVSSCSKDRAPRAIKTLQTVCWTNLVSTGDEDLSLAKVTLFGNVVQVFFLS